MYVHLIILNAIITTNHSNTIIKNIKHNIINADTTSIGNDTILIILLVLKL